MDVERGGCLNYWAALVAGSDINSTSAWLSAYDNGLFFDSVKYRLGGNMYRIRSDLICVSMNGLSFVLMPLNIGFKRLASGWGTGGRQG